MTTTHVLETAGAEIVYDVRGPLPATDGRPPLFIDRSADGRQRLRNIGVALPGPDGRHL
jgi:hypothetical protein